MNELTIIPDLFLQGDSRNYKNWESAYLGIKTCKECRNKHGKIYAFNVDRYNKRILYSNDGLIFVSYDHAKTFYELVR